MKIYFGTGWVERGAANTSLGVSMRGLPTCVELMQKRILTAVVAAVQGY